MSRVGSFGSRLYRGEASIDFVGRQRLWYSISGVILLIGVVSLLTLGLNLGIDFKGGTVFQFPAKAGSTTENVRSTVKSSGAVHEDVIVQKTGTGWRVETGSLDSAEVSKIQNTVAQRYHLGAPKNVSPETVGASWGQNVSTKALQGMVVFLVAVVLYLSVAFEWRMALSALAALLHDIVIAVGIYSLVGFEVTPETVVGLLTILGFSLYDTVVVFDKVRENTRSLKHGRVTYSEAANLGLNQTLARSINTSLIALLPVAGLLFIGAGVLGAGTLKDLALVLFVGMLAGTYSSIFIATPLLADLQERRPEYKKLAERAGANKRRSKKAARPAPAEGGDDRGGEHQDGGVREKSEEASDEEPDEEPDRDVEVSTVGVSGVRLVQKGPRQQPRRASRRNQGKRKR